MHPAELTASELVARIASRQLGAEETARALLDRAESLSALNIFSGFDPERVLADARRADRQQAKGESLGLLHGVPVSLKDNINVMGYPTTAGTPSMRDHRPDRDAPVFAVLRSQGAIAFGKTGMHELAYGATSNNAAFGAPRNPFDPARTAGGSSGGSGAAVAARLGPVSIGTDTGGSVRIPAALCGVWGFRPTTGRWPTDGVVPISSTRDTPGPLTRSARDLALIDRIVTGTAPLAPQPLEGLRIGVIAEYFWEGADDDVLAVCRAALARLQEAGAIIVEVDAGRIAERHAASSSAIALYEGRASLAAFLDEHKMPLSFEAVTEAVASPDVRATLHGQLDPSTAVSAHVYAEAMAVHRPALRSLCAALFRDNNLDVIANPTCRLSAPRLGDDDTVMVGGMAVPTFEALIHNTDILSNVGLPGLTMPVGLTPSGLPVGLALDAPFGEDSALLSLAASLDSLYPALSPDSSFGAPSR